MKPGTSPDRSPARYVVGIDLGTTNSAVSFVDTDESPWRVRTFAVPQLVAPGVVEARETRPSFHYQPAEGEAGALQFPGDHEGRPLQWPLDQSQEPGGKKETHKAKRRATMHTVGVFARDHGAMVPGRLIASAKSWLCHSGVDRTAPLLPWQGAADVERLSPVEVSTRYLAHVRDAWDHRFAKHPLAEQDIVLTLPASFDEVARELTVKAAAGAGLSRVVLIEEPQAAFYAWIYAHAENWSSRARRSSCATLAAGWALGRIGARVPLYGPLNTVVPVETAEQWIAKLTDTYTGEAMGRLAVMQMSRRTGDRYRDLPERRRDKVLAWLERHDAPPHFIELVRDGGDLDTAEQDLVFGESLPKGLRLV